MDSNNEIMLSTADVSKRLKVGSAMVRKWAIAYEAATGDKVRLRSKRDGREFTSSQVAVIADAKRLVDSEGVKVETALKMVLGQAEMPGIAPALATVDGNTAELIQVISEATARGNEPLIAELQQLRQELQRSRQSLESGAAPQENDLNNHGLLVRLALWLEDKIR
jgi:hypothetical protein